MFHLKWLLINTCISYGIKTFLHVICVMWVAALCQHTFLQTSTTIIIQRENVSASNRVMTKFKVTKVLKEKVK